MTHELELPDDELERQLGTMLRERAGAVSQRVTVDRKVVTRARRRRTMKLASLGSGLALSVAIVVVAAVAFNGSPSASPSKAGPATGGGTHVQISVPTTVPTALPPRPSGWSTLPPAPISARAASATAIADDAFVVWGGEGQDGTRLMDGAWYDLRTGQWNVMSRSPLPLPSYPAGQHFVVGQAVGDSVVIVSDGAAAEYTPRANTWKRLPDVPLAGLDNLALAGPNGSNVVVLTGIDRARRPAYAALSFNSLDRVSWTAGTLTGRSLGRPALTDGGISVLVHAVGGGVQLDTVVGFGKPGTTTGARNVVPTSFVPTVWDGSILYGADCRRCGTTTMTALDVSSAFASPINDAYNACVGLHVWTESDVVSWGSTTCEAPGSDIAYNATTGGVTKLPAAPIAERTASDFAVANDGGIYIWGGEDASDASSPPHYLDDGAVLTLP